MKKIASKIFDGKKILNYKVLCRHTCRQEQGDVTYYLILLIIYQKMKSYFYNLTDLKHLYKFKQYSKHLQKKSQVLMQLKKKYDNYTFFFVF